MWICPRSILFVPADKLEIAKKAIASFADAVCVDLEDGVSIVNKQKARGNLPLIAKTGNTLNKRIWIRINTDLQHASLDIESLPDGIDNIVIPKAQGWSQLALLNEAIDKKFAHSTLRPKITMLIEDLASLQHFINTPNNADNKLAAIALGMEDLSCDLGVKPNSELLNPTLYDFVKLGRMLSVPVLGFPGSIANFKNLSLLENHIQSAKQVGAKGSFCIHPKQVEIINNGFSATKDEVEWASGVLSVANLVEQNGVATHPQTQQMIDRPVVIQAKEIIARQTI